MSFNPAFKIGDYVTKLKGKKVAEVTSVPLNSYDYYCCRYTGSGHAFFEKEYNLKVADPYEQLQNMKTLYSFAKEDGSTGYGTHIGTNSQGHYLIEEKGTGVIQVFSKDKLEEVLPYTFSAKIGNTETHYQGSPGTLAVGDVLLHSGGGSSPQVALVTAIDTKNKNARGKFKGAKLVTSPI